MPPPWGRCPRAPVLMWPGGGSPRPVRPGIKTWWDPSRMCDHSGIRLPKAAMTGELVLCWLSELWGERSGYKRRFDSYQKMKATLRASKKNMLIDRILLWPGHTLLYWVVNCASPSHLLPAQYFSGVHIFDNIFYKFRDPKSAIKQEASTMTSDAVRLPSLPVILLLTILMTASRHLM